MVRAGRRGRARIGFLARIFGAGEAEPPAPEGDPARVAQVEAVLADLRPLLAADGGDVRVVAVEPDGRVRLAWRGACERCFASRTTAEGVIAPRLRGALEWVRDVSVR